MPSRSIARAFVAFLRARYQAGEIPNRTEFAAFIEKSRSWVTVLLDHDEGAIDVDCAFRIAAWFDTTVEAIAEGAAPRRITRADEKPLFEAWTKIPADQRKQALAVLRTFQRRVRTDESGAPAGQSEPQPSRTTRS